MEGNYLGKKKREEKIKSVDTEAFENPPPRFKRQAPVLT